MNNEVKAKKHMLCEKAPFLAMILGCLIALVVIGIPSALAGSSFVGQIISCIAAVVFLIGFNRWFAPEFKGVFKAGISAGEMLIISLPFIFELVFTYAASVFDSGFYFNPTLLSLSMALGAGFFEETIFRGVTIPLAMRYLKSKNRMYIIVGINRLDLRYPSHRKHPSGGQPHDGRDTRHFDNLRRFPVCCCISEVRQYFGSNPYACSV